MRLIKLEQLYKALCGTRNICWWIIYYINIWFRVVVRNGALAQYIYICIQYIGSAPPQHSGFVLEYPQIDVLRCPLGGSCRSSWPALSCDRWACFRHMSLATSRTGEDSIWFLHFYLQTMIDNRMWSTRGWNANVCHTPWNSSRWVKVACLVYYFIGSSHVPTSPFSYFQRGFLG